MEPTAYVATLRRRLANARPAVPGQRLGELFRALQTCPPDRVEAVAALATSVVDALLDPRRRPAMLKKMETLSASDWQGLATKQSVQSATRQRPRKGPPRSPPPAKVRSPSPRERKETAFALLGVAIHALQGAGHFEMELERLTEEGRCPKGSPAEDLLRRLLEAMRAAEARKSGVSPLQRMAGKILSAVEDHPERIAELTSAFQTLSAEQLILLAQQHESDREQEQKQIEACITDLELEINRSSEVASIAVRLHRQRDLAPFWGKAERKLIKSIQVHLRQGEELRFQKTKSEKASDSGRHRTAMTATMTRHHLAYRRASQLIARLLITKSVDKTPAWWERVARASLKEIELDSLGAKRIKASRQKELAAEALSSVEQATGQSSGPQSREEQMAADLGRSLSKLEAELAQNPGDRALETRIDQTRELRDHFLTKERENAKARLQDLAEEGAASDGAQSESDWLFGME